MCVYQSGETKGSSEAQVEKKQGDRETGFVSPADETYIPHNSGGIVRRNSRLCLPFERYGRLGRRAACPGRWAGPPQLRTAAPLASHCIPPPWPVHTP